MSKFEIDEVIKKNNSSESKQDHCGVCGSIDFITIDYNTIQCKKCGVKHTDLSIKK